MSSNRYKYFRWTPRTAWISIVYVVAVPSLLYAVAQSTDVRLATGTQPAYFPQQMVREAGG